MLAREGGAGGDKIGGGAREDDPVAIAGGEVDASVRVRHYRLVMLDHVR